MSHSRNINIPEDNDIKKVFFMVLKNYKLFIISIIITTSIAFIINRYTIPLYEVSSSILIKEESNSSNNGTVGDYLNSNIFGSNINFQNELWVLRSFPIIEQTIKNLDFSVSYFRKGRFRDQDVYKNVPFQVLFVRDHVQPINIRFKIRYLNQNQFEIKAESKDEVNFYNFSTNSFSFTKGNWMFSRIGKFGEIIETHDLAFIIQHDSTKKFSAGEESIYSFELTNLSQLANIYRHRFQINATDKKATVVKISLVTESINKGLDLVNELMSVYSQENLARKNHIASITIDYIDKQLSEISDSLSQTEDNLQRFRSSNQLLNVTEQASGISAQYMNLQNQRAELVARKRYYQYVSDYLLKNDDFSDMIVPSSMGISDQILNNLMSSLISAQTQRSNLIANKQEKNPQVKKLEIQIENTKKTISDNISAVRQTTDISIDELNKRIRSVEAQISNLPRTQRQLGGIERKYKLNDAIYSYLLEKRAEAKITQASNLPDNLILEPANLSSVGPISPNKKKNYILAFFVGFFFPLGFVLLKNTLNNKIESQENIENITDAPVLGKILHNSLKTTNVLFDSPKSVIAETFRALRTNLDFYLRGGKNKVLLVTSSIEGEGKSFTALNIAMSFAQLGRKTILLDFDLRKASTYFTKSEMQPLGMSSYLINQATLPEIILKSPHDKLDYIYSGPIPPNPAELLSLEETGKLIDILKNSYDYIVIDTPPLGQVTDGYLLIDKADIKIVVVRSNYSKKNILSVVLKDLNMKKIENVCIVINDNRIDSEQYGYGYGYNKKKK